VKRERHPGERELQADHHDYPWGRLPTRLNRFFRQHFALVVHATILDVAPVAASGRVLFRR
jgi:hypothetical protein